jgi:DNA gyrase subunit A
VKGIRQSGRNTQGVKLLSLSEGDKLLSIARIVETEEEGGDAPAS